jgi:hypothetical protein
VDYKDFINEDGDFSIGLVIKNEEDRNVGFEVSFFVNYRQVEFYMDNNIEKVISYSFNIGNEEEKNNMVIPQEYFKEENIQFLINIRQDTGIHCSDNELLTNTNTINIRYNLINGNGQKNEEYSYNQNLMKKIDETNVESSQLLKLKCLNREENTLICLRSKEEYSMKMNLSGLVNDSDCVFFATMNSIQTPICGLNYLFTEIKRGEIGSLDINMVAPSMPGLYELEVYCILSPFNKLQQDKLEQFKVISSNRYTVKVE